MQATPAPTPQPAPHPAPQLNALHVFMVALGCGVIVANLYYAQPLIGLISADIGLSPSAAGLIVTLTQVGYGVGLLLVVPLGDLFENRRLVGLSLLASSAILVGLAVSRGPISYLTGAALLGLSCVSAQILVPYVAHLVPAARRGEIVGRVMSGLLLGIMLARPLSSLMEQAWGWRPVFSLSAGVNVALAAALTWMLPTRRPEHTGVSYGRLLRSMGTLLRDTPVLRRRGLYHATMFASFSLFWTVTPLLLTGPRFGLTQGGVAWFALAGVAGAIAAPLAGRAADRGHTQRATGWALALGAASYGLSCLPHLSQEAALLLLTLSAILLDMAVSAHLVLSQRTIYALGEAERGRLNGLFMTMFFIGGAVGSSLGVWSYTHGGWAWSAALGALLPSLAWLHHTLRGQAQCMAAQPS